MAPPYLADTNVYVRAANEASFRGRLEAFVERDGPLVVSSVVIAEVLIGVSTLITSNARDFRRLGRHLPVEVLEPFP